MHKILIATYNKGKYTEFQSFFAQHGIETVAAYEMNVPDVEEGETSFAENAKLKAENGWRCTGLPTLADDSGLEIPELNNYPGVLTARITKDLGGYPQAVAHYCSKLNKASFAAKYVAELCLYGGEDNIITSRATVEGMLQAHAKGERDFGYDQWFVPKGYTQTCAEISLAEKEKISHRGKALRQLMEQINRDELRAVS